MGLSKLYLMCGVPGAGKSTWVEQHKGEGVVISRDKIRFSMLHETDEYFSKEPFVYQEFIKQITEALDTNGLVFADATHLNGSSRIKLLRSLGTALTICSRSDQLCITQTESLSKSLYIVSIALPTFQR